MPRHQLCKICRHQHDILKNSPHLDKESEKILRSWFLSLVPQVKEGIYIWHQNDYFNKQEYQNHLASHVLGILALGVVLEDQSLIKLAILGIFMS